MADITTKELLLSMLKENTGRHMLDSGGAHGRHWEQNQKIELEKEPGSKLTINIKNEEMYFVKSLFHYLSSFLENNDITKDLQLKFDALELEMPDDSYLTIMEAFMRKYADNKQISVYNSYNDESSLSQVIQYGLFEYEGDDFIILQIHGGCDVRGGYTAPKIFQMNDINDVFNNDLTYSISFENFAIDTYDMYHWEIYDYNTNESKEFSYKLLKETISPYFADDIAHIIESLGYGTVNEDEITIYGDIGGASFPPIEDLKREYHEKLNHKLTEFAEV